MSYTPAPWKVEIDWEDRHPIAVIDPTTTNHPQGPLHICNVNPNLQDESYANARLIAAAPELLAATKRMINWLEGVSDEIDIIDMALQARAAIQKAEG